MAREQESDPFGSIFNQNHSRIPDDTVCYSIYPDSPLPISSLQSLHLEILHFISPLTSFYIWQHQPFSLSIAPSPSPSVPPHLRGSLRFGDNIDDEWFVVFLLFQISLRFPSLSIQVSDSDGDFLLIEAAYHLPRWLNPDSADNRVFIRRGLLHIIPKRRLPNPSLADSLAFLVAHESESVALEPVQSAVKARISEYPERARRNMHRARVRVPASVAQVLKEEPCLISLAAEGFYDRDIDTMKYAAKMERFLEKGKGEELVCVAATMSRAMYAQLMQQKFQAPKVYPMPSRENDVAGYLEAELGMKITCGFEMIYWQRKKEGEEGKGSAWVQYKETLEKSGYFDGALPGSKEYKRLMHNAEEHYRNSSLFSRVSEMLSAPVRRIDEILTLPYSGEDFKHQVVPPSDDDSWLYSGEDELNAALQARQVEMDLFDKKYKGKQKSGEPQENAASSSGANFDEFDLGDMVEAMQSFVKKVSSYKGAEVPDNRNMKMVDLDADQFLKDMESVMNHHGREDDASNADTDEGSSSDLDFDDSEDGLDIMEPSGGNGDGEDEFMQTYSDALNEELKESTLRKSFIHANDQSSSKPKEGTSNGTEDMDEDLTPVDVDVNLVKSLLDSFSSQQGQPGPASNLLGLMGLKLPQDANKDR
ncbi:hypothetical protein Tsubulata_002680 [Turnera subulata]|uniref:Protein ecdysoneless homolog n=1 Tax=Turnera subulata TaxID=218843 RepID=A0A9Q0F7K4_9ROSI|nr:hypothetical protein Tsubulata_002680 [Turnera subulata]